MSKRFTDTELWSEDWFIDIPKDYKLFWMYLKDQCDHCGIWRCNIKKFNRLNECNVSLDTAIEFFNQDEPRIFAIDDSKWLLVGFVPFQYGKVLNKGNRVHLSIVEKYNSLNINIEQIRGQIEVKERSVRPKEEDKEGVKDKDKDINKRVELFYDDIKKYLDKYSKDMLREFFDYWSELNKSKTKMKCEMEKTWDLGKRLVRWSNNNFNGSAGQTKEDDIDCWGDKKNGK